MNVTGDEFGAGRRSWDENVAQYFWSGVKGDGAAGRRTGGRDVTSAAILASCRRELRVVVGLQMRFATANHV
jgi:hypothetical protein